MDLIPTLHTERLILRPLAPADAPAVECLAGDRQIAANTLNIPHPYTAKIAADWIRDQRQMAACGNGLGLAVTLVGKDALIGAIGLKFDDAAAQAELGYWIGVPYWGRGYCTEAARALLGFGFGYLKLNRIHCCHFSRNPASGRVMRKLGMHHEGCRRQHVRKWNRLEDLELYGILHTDWTGESSARAQTGGRIQNRVPVR